MIRPLIFNKVSEGLFKQVKLDIVYFKSENEEEVQLRVSPLGLVQQDVRLYLVCCYEDTTQIRNLALHRIKKVELTTFIAEEPKGFDLQQYVDRSPFNYGNAQKVLLEMVFKNRQTALILRETPFNRMQKLEERRDGTFKLTVEVADTVLLTGWIEAWREKAGIISVKKTPINRQQKSRCSSGIFVEDSRRIIRGPYDRNISDDGCFFFDRMRNGSRLQREILRLSN